MSSPRYEFLEHLGQGGAGTVYKAWDSKLQRAVAIKKLLPPEKRGGEGVGTDLLKEASALSALQHPNVVSVYDVEHLDESLCVIMEFINGETLETTMKRGALNRTDFASVAKQSLEGLIAAHRLGIQHRDIKPSNIMVNWLPNGDFLVKLLDFGLADFTHHPHLQVMEGENSIYGTVQFMAPEQFTRNPVDVRTDLYSLGCVLYYTLVGSYPFQASDVEGMIQAHLNAQFSPLFPLRQDLPKIMCDWVEWLMRLEPDHRPTDAGQALEIFKQIEAGRLYQLPIKPLAQRRTGAVHVPTTGRVPGNVTPAWRPTSAPAPVYRPPTAQQPTRQAHVPKPKRKKSAFSPGILVTLGLLVVAMVAAGWFMLRDSASPMPTLTVTVAIIDPVDDAEETAAGEVDLGSSDIELTEHETNKPQTIGLRFRSVPVPAGSTITSATIQFTSDEVHTRPTSLTIAAEAADSAPTFARTPKNISNRPRTKGSAQWTPAPWTTEGAAGPDQRTPDLSSIVQEIISRPGWVEGNAMTFIITGSGRRNSESRNKDKGTPAQLTIQYTTTSIVLTADKATLSGKSLKLLGATPKHLGEWYHRTDNVSWNFPVDKAGEYEVTLNYASHPNCNGNQIKFVVGKEELSVSLPHTGAWVNFKPHVVGKIKITQSGDLTLTLIPGNMNGGSVMNLRSVTLKPL